MQRIKLFKAETMENLQQQIDEYLSHSQPAIRQVELQMDADWHYALLFMDDQPRKIYINGGYVSTAE